MTEQITFSPQPKQLQFLESSADITIFGGAAGGGKSWSLLYEPFHDTSNAKFGAVIFRRTYPQIMQQGGLWDISEEIYPFAGAAPNKGNAQWKFPSGATVSFRHMENEDDRYKYDGAQISLIEFDQLESFTAKQFFYMLSRNRSMSGAISRIRASANPQPGWLSEFLQWWWDEETGYAIPERSGKRRWFVRIQDSLRWADTREELVKKFPQSLPKSVEFILSKIHDNEILMKKDPGYLASLMALPLIDRERLLGGNWKISVAGNIFKREWWRFVDQEPAGIIDWVRFWDFAATAPDPKNKDPDWTAGVKMCRGPDGAIYIKDCQHFRESAATNEKRAKATAQLDGTRVRVRWEEEGGASGKSFSVHLVNNVFLGFDAAGVKPKVSKIIRWKPLSAAAEQGRVFLVKGSWNQDFVDELEGCKGEDEKNDQCLVAGTLIAAANGPKNIEAITTDDFVLTRQGWKKVVWAGQTGWARSLVVIKTDNENNLTGTKNHLFFCSGRGFIRLDAAKGAFETLCLKNTDIRMASSQSDKFITGTSTNLTKEQFQKGKLFTTRMATTQTTTSTILKLSRLKGILKFTGKGGIGIPAILALLALLKEEGQWLLRGTEVKTEGNGTRSMLQKWDWENESGLLSVCGAPDLSFANVQLPNVVQQNARKNFYDLCQKIKSNYNVVNAATLLKDLKKTLKEEEQKSIAPLSAVAKCFKKKGQPVYNLKVEGCPEFFANGILVHNCDAASGALEDLAVGTGAFGSADQMAGTSRNAAGDNPAADVDLNNIGSSFFG